MTNHDSIADDNSEQEREVQRQAEIKDNIPEPRRPDLSEPIFEDQTGNQDIIQKIIDAIKGVFK